MASCKHLPAVGSDQKCVGRVAGWAVHFDRLLTDPTGHAAFAVSVKDCHCDCRFFYCDSNSHMLS